MNERGLTAVEAIWAGVVFFGGILLLTVIIRTLITFFS